MIVAPPAGTAVLFVGTVKHAGIAVTAGERWPVELFAVFHSWH